MKCNVLGVSKMDILFVLEILRVITHPSTLCTLLYTSTDFLFLFHSESAGHQADLCEHLVLNSTTCQGYLQKLTTGTFRNTWHKKWFIFDRTLKKLSYYNSRKSSLPSDKNSKSVNSNNKDCTHIGKSIF